MAAITRSEERRMTASSIANASAVRSLAEPSTPTTTDFPLTLRAPTVVITLALRIVAASEHRAVGHEKQRRRSERHVLTNFPSELVTYPDVGERADKRSQPAPIAISRQRHETAAQIG